MQANDITIDFYNLGFDFIPTRMMFESNYKNGKWDEGTLKPLGPIEMMPSACVLNYGQGIFEGMKALRTKDGRITLFRPRENAKRLNKSALRLSMPTFDEDKFLDVIQKVVKANQDFIPPYDSGGSLYIRPIMIGSGAVLGIKPASEYKFIVFVSPVGPYFPDGFQCISIEVSQEFTRSSVGGTGFSKTCSNYAGTMMPAKKAKKRGFSQVLFLDSVYRKYISEVGAANFCAIIDNTLVTPRRDGTILEGITLQSLLEIAEKKLGIPVEERDIEYSELYEDSCTEAFCTGTAAVVTPIGSISSDKGLRTFNGNKPGLYTRQLYELLTGIQYCDLPDEFGWVTIL